MDAAQASPVSAWMAVSREQNDYKPRSGSLAVQTQIDLLSQVLAPL